LSERLQTHVYPYVLTRAGQVLEGGPPMRPGQVKMIYWFANFPSTPERFAYDDDQYRADEQYLRSLVEDVEARLRACSDGALLQRTDDRARCAICRYRSLCRRGVEPGSLDETEQEVTSGEPFEFSLDFEQIAELDAG
jgi:hypothetical protein